MYSARITREHRTAFLLLSDRSGSMSEEVKFRGERMSKSTAVTHIINMFIDELVYRCRREEGVRDYFDIAVLEYSGDGVQNLLAGKGEWVCPSLLVRMPVKVKRQYVERMLPSGNTITATIDQRCWVEAKAYGDTPMGSALSEAYSMISSWCASPANRDSFPPVVINITDGEASDAEHSRLCDIADSIKSCSTTDGNVLIFNIHLAGAEKDGCSEISFPSSPDSLPAGRYARLLYDMSSEIPERSNDLITSTKKGESPPYRAMSYNCSVEELFSMLAIGSVSMSMTI